MADAHGEPRRAAGGARVVSGPTETLVETALGATRVWRQGRGNPLVYLPGLGGLPRWTPFLEALAEQREVVVPSLPGFPGGPSADPLDDHLDWIVAARDTVRAAGLGNADLAGASVGAALAAEVAALWPEAVRRLVLIAPFGLFDPEAPVADVFAQRPGARSSALSAKPEELDAWLAPPEGADAVEWEVMRLHATSRLPRFSGRSATRASPSAFRASRRRRCCYGDRRTAWCRRPTRSASRT